MIRGEYDWLCHAVQVLHAADFKMAEKMEYRIRRYPDYFLQDQRREEIELH
jgi:hypothetical protein